MRVTTLVEDSPAPARAGLVAEHGLSLLIEHDGESILFDTGASGVFVDNATRLGIDLEQVTAVVLSHRHYDHGGGLERFLTVNSRAKVYLRAWRPGELWFRALGVLRRRVGLDEALFERHRERFHPVSNAAEIRPGVHLLTDLRDTFPRPRGNRYLWVKRGGTLQPDPFDHELLMVIEGPDGLVVLTGCSHNGILNLVDTAVRRLPGVPIAAVLGGFHLVGLPGCMAASRREVEILGRQVMQLPVRMVYAGHCTGQKAYRILKAVIGERLGTLATGSTVDV